MRYLIIAVNASKLIQFTGYAIYSSGIILRLFCCRLSRLKGHLSHRLLPYIDIYPLTLSWFSFYMFKIRGEQQD